MAPPDRCEVAPRRLIKLGLSVRPPGCHLSTGRGHRTVIGAPGQIADAMEEWTDSGAADGFNIIPSHLPNGIDDFVDLVVPELQRRGLFRTEYEGGTLRENPGL